MKTLHEGWSDLADRLPAEATQVQKDYLRRIFYAGANTVITLLSTNLSEEVGHGPPLLDDEIYVERLLQEMQFFEEDRVEGRV
jgi:hypothetical protein